ncbi:MAG: 23S rRNA (uracil(1939)-C(5))-methyltransferase RlmD [Planctomycetota bacterium]
MELRCQHFGVCGGCTALTTPIEAQLAQKTEAVRRTLGDLLTGPDGVQVESPPRPPQPPRHYRTKLLYPAVPDRRGRANLGIYRRGSHDLERIRECQIQDRGLTEFAIRAERVLRQLRLAPWNEQRHEGVVRAVFARLAAGTGELLIGVATQPGLLPQGPDLAEALLEAASDLPHAKRPTQPVGVVRALVERPGNYLLGDRHVPLRGRDHVIDRQDGLRFRVSSASFYQIHRAAHAVLYRPALRLLGDVTGLRVVDAFGGVGAFGLRLAAAGAARVTIVEASPAACRDASVNANQNGLGQVEVRRGDFAEAAIEPGADLLVLDPARRGLGADGVARALAAQPRRILYASCQPSSLARDLTGLRDGGYRLRAVRVCDLFPYTEHAEVLALLERRR